METEVGGLSGLTYDVSRGVFYALTDEGGVGDKAPRFYTVDIDYSDGMLDPGDVTFVDVTHLTDKRGKPYEEYSLDPEGIAMPLPGQLYISSEGATGETPPIDPFVNRYSVFGKENRALSLPEKFLPDGSGTVGVRDNLAFEGLTSTPNRRYLYAATENALIQDGPKSTLDDESPSRVLQLNLTRGRHPGAEYVYVVSEIPVAPPPPETFADNGLSEILALDNAGTFLVMERNFTAGVGNTVRLFQASTDGATDVSEFDSLVGETYTPMTKDLVADLEGLGYDPDNLEAMAFGPGLLDGEYKPLILVSDNNFRASQSTQFILLGVKLEPAP
jgi:hypothetical protein